MNNYTYLILLILGMLSVLIGAYLKLNAMNGANELMFAGLLLKPIAVIGAIWHNRESIIEFIKKE